QGQLLDTIVLPYGTFPNGGKRGSQMVPGMVKLRMDFRGKNIVGTFVYHCHLLEHEDNGMMAKIRVLP
ncbi:MAG: multicopper oxidase domain-containing protein, partial [Candidatus Baltobacteraceae bacterium]